jgi:hypothetical protein
MLKRWQSLRLALTVGDANESMNAVLVNNWGSFQIWHVWLVCWVVSYGRGSANILLLGALNRRGTRRGRIRNPTSRSTSTHKKFSLNIHKAIELFCRNIF